jgi:hypothetical protein
MGLRGLAGAFAFMTHLISTAKLSDQGRVSDVLCSMPPFLSCRLSGDAN